MPSWRQVETVLIYAKFEARIPGPVTRYKKDLRFAAIVIPCLSFLPLTPITTVVKAYNHPRK